MTTREHTRNPETDTGSTAIISISYDGVRSLYCGVGTMTLALTEVLSELRTRPRSSLHLITPALSGQCRSFDKEIEQLSLILTERHSGRVHSLTGAYSPNDQWGSVDVWKQTTPDLVDQIEDIASEYDECLVIAHDAPFLAAAAELASTLENGTVWAVMHGAGSLHDPAGTSSARFQWEQEALHASGALRVVAVSRFMREHLLSTYGLPDSQILSIHNGMWDSQLEDQLPDRRLPAPPVKRLLLAYGRSEPYKGLASLLEAATNIEWPPNTGALIVASPDTSISPEAARMAHRDVPENVVVYPHRVNRPALKSLYERMEVVSVCPSHTEPFGLVPAETRYWAEERRNGIAIASARGGLKEQISDGIDGLLLNPDDRDSVETTIATALAMPDEDFETMAFLGSRTLRQRYWFPTNMSAALRTCGLAW